ncbi:DUF3307 domain-containing protein [Halococcoides cellulosivorans]|uniref:DUF3307 domain-containing protein n=1 Tax=Halococcoides cellulosivorans TaxID=1679096 RepID=A0A2R4WZD5_9EURY|nr:DUF3307 domain-containing protein [Halococcoides cellulosivorans]AWB26908.1 hypothetical protein HARCEL1_03855 [Halococcoides cellulosivorans]
MSEWLIGLGPAGTALGLLLVGHMLGEFVFQTDDLADRDFGLGPLFTHVGIVAVTHVVAIGPLLNRQAVALLVLVVGSHLVIDAVSGRIRKRTGSSLRLFLGDQGAHLLVLVAGWALIDAAAWANAPVVAALGATSVPWPTVTTGAVYLSAFVFAHEGGKTIVDGILPDDGPESEGNDLEVGSLIGTLERWIVLTLGLAGLWQAVALVVAAKSVARFEELKQRAFAEYFLVGTLSSVLVAFVLVAVVSRLV